MLEVIDSGFYTSLQDKGRVGYRHLGVPVSGAMDPMALELAQQLLGTVSNTTSIECTLIGPTLRFHAPCVLVLTGAVMNARLNKTIIENNKAVEVSKDDVLKLGRVTKGLRTYIKINQELVAPTVLGSTSFYTPITQESVLKKGDCFLWDISASEFVKGNARIRWDDAYLGQKVLDVFSGPEFNLLSKETQQKLFGDEFLISSQNRMGYRIESPFQMEPVSMFSGAVRPGTVQITPSGTLLITGMDGQVSGGYPRIFQLSEEAQSVLAQKKEGDCVSFKLLDKLQ